MRGRLAFLLFGLLLIAGAGYLHAQLNTSGSRTILTGTVGLFLSLVVIRLAADALLKTKSSPRVLKVSDVRRTKPPVLRRWLRQGAAYRPTFFRAPPAFVDFEENYVLTHPGLEEITASVRSVNRGLIIVEGPPASGKSTLLRHLEYALTTPKLLRRRRTLFVCNCKNILESDLEQLRDGLDLIPRRSIVIFDDVHIFLLRLTTYAEHCRSRDLVLIYGTRPLANYESDHVRALGSLRPVTFSVAASAVAGGIIDRYLEVEYGLDDPTKLRGIYGEYATDLWVLSAALQASHGGPGGMPHVSKADVNQWILRNTLSDTMRGDLAVPRSSVLAPLASLYRYEVATERRFLTEGLGVAPEVLQAMIESGDILAVHGGSVRLHHSSLAQLIVDALSTPDRIGLVPLAALNGGGANDAWCDRLVRLQIESSPTRSTQILVDVARSSGQGRQLASHMLEQLGLERFERVLSPGTSSVEALGGFLELWREMGGALTVRLKDCVGRYLTQGTDEGARSWAWATYNVARLDRELGVAFADKLSILIATEPPHVVADIGTTLSYVDLDLSRRAFAAIDHAATIETMRSDVGLSLNEMAMEFAKLVWVDERFGANFQGGAFEIFPDLRASELPAILSRIAWGNPIVARALLMKTDLLRLESLLQDVSLNRIAIRRWPQ